MSWTIHVPSLMLIAQAVLLLEHGHMHKVTGTADRHIPRLSYWQREIMN